MAAGARSSATGGEERSVGGPGGKGAALRLRPRVRLERAVVLSLLLLACAVGAVGNGGATSAQAEPKLYAGLGFDSCDAPAISTLQAWLASPYRALGIYIGGSNRACPNSQLSASWVASAVGIGWALAPLYVGLQAPCSALRGAAKISAALAAGEGTAAADDAVADAGALGLPPASPIYFDMEGYALDNPSCTQTVQTFLSAWVAELHNHGYLAGVYGSADSTLRDVQALTTTAGAPDDVWIGDWNGDTSVFGDPYVSDSLWTNHQRIHQFAGGHDESYGGVELNIDSDALDAAVVSATPSAPVPPTPAPPPVVSTLSAAGSVSSPDGTANVSWQAGTFQHSVVVSLNPSLPAQPVPGFGSGGYGIALKVQQTGTSLSTSSFSVPLTIHIAAQPGNLAPVSSPDGTTWQALPELVGNLLPVALNAAFAREPDGSVEIQTRSPGDFALLPDTTPPPAPASLSGHFSHGSLVLSWPASSDASGNAVSYQVTLTNQPLLTVAGQTTAALRAFHPHAPSVYRVTALDAAGNTSPPSPPLVVLPSKRPLGVPDFLPSWAWALYTWQQQGEVGPRPTAPDPAPGWYWRWRAWRVAPFHLRA